MVGYPDLHMVPCSCSQMGRGGGGPSVATLSCDNLEPPRCADYPRVGPAVGGR